MKTNKNLPMFASKSANTNPLKKMNEKEQEKLNALIEKASKNGLKNFALIYNVDGKIYGFKTPIANCLARIKTNASGKNTTFKIFSPLANGQVKNFIEQGLMTYYGTEKDLEQIREKHNNLKNNGQAVEYLINKKEHTTIDHTKSLIKGGDNLFGDTEIKYFVIGASSPSCRLFDNVRV